MIDIDRMKRNCDNYGIHLSQNQFYLLDQYSEFLIEYNRKVNLTAITAAEEVETKHFLDCLLLAIQPEVRGKIADVGSGAGFPGVVIKIYNEKDNDITLFEPTGKRVEFLKKLADLLQLNITIEKERAEEAGRKKWRETFDVVTARAVANLAMLSEYCLPLVCVWGYFIAMKGCDEQEAQDALPGITKLGGALQESRKFILPDGSTRQLIVVKKVKNTDPKYPRNGGAIAKRPLK